MGASTSAGWNRGHETSPGKEGRAEDTQREREKESPDSDWKDNEQKGEDGDQVETGRWDRERNRGLRVLSGSEMKCLLTVLGALLCCCCCCCRASNSQPLDPDGKNVCLSTRDASRLVCCTGWRQEGRECTIPVCEGEQACLKDELCVYPGVCRCPPGFFGAHCKTRCPPEFWGSDCRQVCRCHPHGRCHPVTGDCTCNSNRWGPQCQFPCKCTRHGHCHPLHGNCTCDEGWWTATCAKPCQCVGAGSAGAGCEQLTGRCQCRRGHWGLKCPVTCNCHMSACNQRTGVCECEAGWWGPSCDRRCNCDLRHSSCGPGSGQCLCHPGYQGPYCNQACGTGTYGSGCQLSCGRCKDAQHCSTTDGSCSACEPGWNGTRCDRPCPPGYHGDGCQEACPRCRTNEPCDPETGKCRRCDPGWKGPRCEELCSDRMFGEACSFLCSPCYHGNCHHVTGRCVCQPGFQGESCNSSCSALQFGLNCSSACDCGEGVGCHTVTGACPSNGRGAVIAGVLVPVMLLLLAVLCCCLCCGGGPVDSKDRAAVAEGGWSVRMKYHVYSVLANISAALPCISSWSSGLPRVTVSHHDPELTFNHSFIEPPSSGWVTEGSSFDSDEEEGEALYCVPPREDIPAVAGGEFQEMSSKCNMFLDPSGFSSEDITSPFNIPRTSSIAKSKRPSVSFAEGTRFSPKERQGSAQDPAQATPLRNKPKSTWGVLMLSALQGQGGAARPGEAESAEGEEEAAPEETACEAGEQEVTSQAPGSAGRRRTTSNQAQACGSEPQGSHKVTTVYVTVGKGGGAVSETASEGPVQAMLRRLGSLQRQRDQESGRSKSKGGKGITKPPRRKLGARASAWEQGGAAPGGEAAVCKPIRRKHQNSCEAAGESETGAPKRPLSSILKSVPELVGSDPGSDPRSEGEEGEEAAESNYLTVGAVGEAASLTQVIANEAAVVGANDEPCYENVMIHHS